MSGYANLSKSNLRTIAKTIDTLNSCSTELVLSQETFILLEYEKEFEGVRQQDVILFNITFKAVQLKLASWTCFQDYTAFYRWKYWSDRIVIQSLSTFCDPVNIISLEQSVSSCFSKFLYTHGIFHHWYYLTSCLSVSLFLIAFNFFQASGSFNDFALCVQNIWTSSYYCSLTTFND